MTQEENLTIMENYEEKYKEALEWMRSIYPTMQGAEKEDAEHYFPELCESEDERIRKEILEYFQQFENEGLHGVNISDWIAWLEKQREKTNPYSGISFEYNGHIWGMCARDNGVDILCDSQLIKHIEKQGEKKSATEHSHITPNSEFFQWIYDRLKYVYHENPNVDYMLSLKERIEDMQKPTWSEEEKTRIDRIINVLDWAEEKGRISYSDWEDYVTYVKSLKPQNKQNTAWNEEDEKMYESILTDTVQEITLDNRQINWIRSLKDRVQPQPKQEWSEEDENLYNLCIAGINTRYNAGYFTKSEYKKAKLWLKSLKDSVQPNQKWSKEDEKNTMWLVRLISTGGFRELDSDKMPCSRIELLEWLKSLKSQKHWKPSEEQMESSNFYNRYDSDELYSRY